MKRKWNFDYKTLKTNKQKIAFMTEDDATQAEFQFWRFFSFYFKVFAFFFALMFENDNES